MRQNRPKPRSSRGRTRPPARRRRRSQRSAGWRWRIALALTLLAAGLGVVGFLTFTRLVRRPAPGPGDTVAAVAARHGVAAEFLDVERVSVAGEPAWVMTLHVPAGFPVEAFSLDLEATAHNLGGWLEHLPLMERGGYGLVRLEGEVEGEHWRVLVLGEEPPPPRLPPVREISPVTMLPRLAIVLDDAGYSLEPLSAISRLPRAVAVAVLPNTPFATEVAAALVAEGREVLLHLPMEPLAGHGPGPGPGAVESGLSDEEVRQRVAAALRAVPGARGVNNHMGSLATTMPELMRPVMEVLRGEGLYFLDSRTTPATVAEQTAREAGVPALRRDVFLDVVGEPGAIRRALDQAVDRARRQGSAVAIGHVTPVTLELLASDLVEALDEVELVTPSRLLADQ